MHFLLRFSTSSKLKLSIPLIVILLCCLFSLTNHLFHTRITSQQQHVHITNYGYGAALVGRELPKQPGSTTVQPFPSDPMSTLLQSLFGLGNQSTSKSNTQQPSSTNNGASPVVQLVQQGFVLPLAIEIQNTLRAIFAPNSVLGFVWVTPLPMTVANDTILSIWSGMRDVSVAFLGVFLAWEFLKIMLKQSTVDYASALEVLPKIVFAFFGSLLSVAIARELIVLNNDFCTALNQSIFQQFDTNNLSILYEIAWFVYAVMWFLLVIQAAIRVVLIGACICTGPLAVLTLCSKETEAIGRLWISTLTASIFVQAFQVLCIYIGIHWIVDSFGMTNPSTVVVGLLASIAVLYLAVELPRLFQNAALHSMRTASQSFTHTVSQGTRNISSSAVTLVKALV